MARGESVAIGGTDLAANSIVLPGLASGASCTINVTFTPSTTGSVTGTLSITDNAAGSPQAVSLSGAGISASGYRQEVAVLDPALTAVVLHPCPHHSF